MQALFVLAVVVLLIIVAIIIWKWMDTQEKIGMEAERQAGAAHRALLLDVDERLKKIERFMSGTDVYDNTGGKEQNDHRTG